MSCWALRAVELLESRQFLSGGGLDRNFGGDGVLQFKWLEVNPEAIAFEPSGKLLTGSGTSVMRLTGNGDLDPSFGDGGKLDVGFRPAGIVVQMDGKIVVGGSVQNQWTVARFNPDWTPDASFGKGGARTITVGKPEVTVSASSLAVFPDGAVVLAGTYLPPDDPDYDIDYTFTAVARFNEDGSVDRDFGDAGVVVDGSGHWMNNAETVLAKPNGNVILLAHTWSGGHTNWPWLVEYDPKGEPVRTGSYGPTPEEYYGNYTGGTVRPDGAVVISQYDYVPPGEPPSRIFLDGRRIDVDFSPGANAEEWAGPVTSDASNRIIVAGYSDPGSFGVQRFTKDGVPDASFGINGSASAGPGYATDDIVAVAVAPDGDILVTADLYNQDVIFVRFDAQDPPRVRRRPTASVRPPSSPVRPKLGARRLVFEVEFAAEKRITRRSLDDNDIVVRGPNGYRANATFKDFRKTANGRIVEYVIPSPGKRWDPTDNGTYHVSVRGNEVFDNFGTSVAGGTIGEFEVQVAERLKKLAAVRRPAVRPTPPRRVNAGDLDPTFGGGDGVIVYDDLRSTAHMVLQPDGKILLAQDKDIVRLNPNGSLDDTFGGGDGRVTFGIPVVGLDVMPDGRIVAAGYDEEDEGVWHVGRFNADGSRDPGFAGPGGHLSILSGGAESLDAMALTPDGGVLLGGTYWYSRAEDEDRSYMLRRINADGTPDWTFAGDGIYRGPRNRGDNDLHEIVVDTDGTIVGLVQSTSGPYSSRGEHVVLDKSGKPTTGNYARPTDDFLGSFNDAVVRPDGTVVLTRTEAATGFNDYMTFDDDPELIRLDFDVPRSGGDVHERSIDVTSDRRNRVIVAGWTGLGLPETYGLQRFLPDGLPDATFGFGGTSRFSFGPAYPGSNIRTIAATTTGDILVAGSTGDGRLALARVEGSSPRPRRQPPRAALEGDGDVSVPPSGERWIEVRYAAQKKLDARSLDDRDIFVRGPDGTEYDVTFSLIDEYYDGEFYDDRQMRVRYLLAPPGGTWDAADDGTYTVHVRPGQVWDRFRSSVPAGKIGEFTLDTPPWVEEMQAGSR